MLRDTWEAVPIVLTVIVPLILLALAFAASWMRTSDKWQLTGLLVAIWLVCSVVISLESGDLLRWDPGILTVIFTSLGVWVAMHRLTSDLTWRYRWLLHLLVAGLFAAFLFLLFVLYAFGTSPHY
jgi:hypothetical protein